MRWVGMSSRALCARGASSTRRWCTPTRRLDPELARMTRAQPGRRVGPVLAHREFVTTAVYGAADDALLGSLLDTLTLAYTALHPVATDERSGRFTRSPRCAASSTSGHSAPGLRWTA